MPEPVFDDTLALADDLVHLGEHAFRVLGVQALDPELLVVTHFPRGVTHDRLQVLADERAGVVPGHLGGIDDGRARTDQRLEVVHQGHALAERLFGSFSRGDIRPGANDLGWAALVILDDPEGVLDPDVVPVAVPEAVLQGAAALLHQRAHLAEDTRDIVGVQAHGPEILVLQHLPRREPHDAGDVLADEGAGIVAGLNGVNDRGRDRHEVLETPSRRFQLGSAFVDASFQVLVRLAKLFLLVPARPQVGGETDRADLLAMLTEQDRGRDQDGNLATVLCP